MISIEFLFFYYLLTFMAVFAGISGIILTVRGIIYAKRLGGDGDIAGAKLHIATATLLTSATAILSFAEPSFPRCALLGSITLLAATNAYIAYNNASLLVNR